MSRLRVHNFAISLDGYGAGPNQSRDNPLGDGGEGGGERLFDNLDGGPDGYECVELVSSPSVVHARFARAQSPS